MRTISGEQFKKTYGAETAASLPAAPKQKSLTEKAGEFATGFAKGGIQTAVETARLFQGIGQRSIAALDPTRNLEQVRQQTGFKSLGGEDAAGIDEILKSKSGYEKAGKATEFIAELLFPAGKTKLAGQAKNAITGSVDNLIEKASSISDNVVDEGVKVKDKIAGLVNNLDDKTKTALTRTTRAEFDKVVEMGRKAMLDDRATTPIEEVGKEFVNQAQRVKNRINQIGKTKGEILNKAKNAYLDVSKEVGEAILKIRKGTDGLGSDDIKFVNEIIAKLKPYIKNGKLKDVDAVIDTIQDNLYKLSESEKAVQLTDRATGLIRSAVEGLNKTLQSKVGGSYERLNKQYSQGLRFLTQFNRAVGKNGERAGSFMKQFFSPAGQTAKNLIAQMEKTTHVDFSRNARLAKFVMDALGDVRAESLLEQIPTSKGAVVNKILDFIVEQTGIKDPIKAAEKFIEQNVK